jgi:hypothetical protein
MHFAMNHPNLFAMLMTAVGLIALHQQIVYWCTIAHNILPPWDWLRDFPSAVRWYKAGVYIIGWGAGNLRSTVYQSISTKDGTTPSPVVIKNGK